MQLNIILVTAQYISERDDSLELNVTTLGRKFASLKEIFKLTCTLLTPVLLIPDEIKKFKQC